MKFTRSQFAKTFGVSMESLRYLEKNGILQIARNEDNQYMEYTEDQIPIVLSIKKFGSFKNSVGERKTETRKTQMSSRNGTHF